MTPILYIVIPCYNEEAVLPITAPLFLKKIQDLSAAGKISEDSRILFVRLSAAWPNRIGIISALRRAATGGIRMRYSPA